MENPFTLSLSLSAKTSVLSKIKEAYLLWVAILPHITRSSRFTLGTRIENKFLDLLELSYIAYFSKKEEKIEKIDACIFALDIIKYLLSISWEGKIISHKQFEELILKLDEIGRILGGWKNSLLNPEKKNRTFS